MTTQATHKRSIVKASQNFFSGTLISRALGLVRDVTMAYFLGASAPLAALLVAFRFSHLLRRIFGEGALHSAFVPLFEKKRLQCEKEASYFFISISLGLLLFLGCLTLIFEVGARYWMKYVLVASSAREILSLMRVLFPSLFFICHAAFCSSYLQCHSFYFLSAFSPALFNLFWIAGVFATYYITGSIYGLAVFILLGLIAQWGLLIPKTLKLLFNTLEKNLFSEFKKYKSHIFQLIKPLSMGLLGASAVQLNSALDSLFARSADLNGPAYLWYALRIHQLPLALFAVALSGALLPPLSQAFLEDAQKYCDLIQKYLLRLFVLLLPSTFFLIGFGQQILEFLYRYGHFDGTSLLQTRQALTGYSCGLVFQGACLIFSTAYYAAKDYKTPMYAAFLSLGSNFILNSLAVFYWGLPASSVAWTTSISSLIQCLFLTHHFSYFKQTGLLKFLIKKIFTYTLFVSVAFAFTCLVNGKMLSAKMHLNSYFLMRLWNLLQSTVIFIAFLFSALKIFKLNEVNVLIDYLPLPENKKKRFRV